MGILASLYVWGIQTNASYWNGELISSHTNTEHTW